MCDGLLNISPSSQQSDHCKKNVPHLQILSFTNVFTVEQGNQLANEGWINESLFQRAVDTIVADQV